MKAEACAVEEVLVAAEINYCLVLHYHPPLAQLESINGRHPPIQDPAAKPGAALPVLYEKLHTQN